MLATQLLLQHYSEPNSCVDMFKNKNGNCVGSKSKRGGVHHNNTIPSEIDSISFTKVWTDGSCTGNGTPKAKCGIGVHYGPGDKRNRSVTLLHGKITNNRAELSAILYVMCTNIESNNLQIFTDSLYSVACINSYRRRWETNGWVTTTGKTVESLELIKYMYYVIDRRKSVGGMTVVAHVKGHAQDVGNNAADLLARLATTSIVRDPMAEFMVKLCRVPL